MDGWTGERVAQLRKACGFKQAELARLLGIDRAHLGRLEIQPAKRLPAKHWPWLSALQLANERTSASADPAGQPWTLARVIGGLLAGRQPVTAVWFEVLSRVHAAEPDEDSDDWQNGEEGVDWQWECVTDDGEEG